MATYTVWVTEVWNRGSWEEETVQSRRTIEAASAKEAEILAAVDVEAETTAPIIEVEAHPKDEWC